MEATRGAKRRLDQAGDAPEKRASFANSGDDTERSRAVLICLDDFKGSVSSREGGGAVAEQLQAMYGNAVRTTVLTISDGGDGFLEALRDPLQLEYVRERVIGIEIEAHYGWSQKEDGLAVVEMAIASGLSKLEDPTVLEPMKATTFGTGQLMLAAAKRGAKRIVVGLGGSATTDGGLGCLQALGLEVAYSDDLAALPSGSTAYLKYACGGSLSYVQNLVAPVSGLLPGVTVDLAVDVTNPLVGPSGSAAVFSKQKGANFYQQMELEKGLLHLASLYATTFGIDVSATPGAGAAGGLAGGLIAMGANVKRGMEVLDDAIGLANHVKSADLVITGEGRYDAQTSAGKVVSYLGKLGRKFGVPVVVLCGSKKDIPDHIYELVELYDIRTSMTKPHGCLKGLVSVKANRFPVLDTLVPQF